MEPTSSPAAQAIAATVLLRGGEGALPLLPVDLEAGARAELERLAALDRVRRVTTLGRTVPSALRPAPAPDSVLLCEVVLGVPALGPALRALGLPVPVVAPVRTARGPSREVLGTVAAALGPGAAPVPAWCPPPSELAESGVRLLVRAVRDLDARGAAALCGRLAPAEARRLVALRRTGVGGDADVARRILAAASRDDAPEPLALRVGAYRVGWALGETADAPAGWPAPLVAAVRRAQAIASLSAPEGDAAKEREALGGER